MANKGQVAEKSELKCGLVMPISAIDGCSADHWLDVKNILIEAVSSVSSFKFNAVLVSDADDTGFIQRRIVQNLYDSDIIVCDVSCKNPNVMFELGIRLAFDKATVIIKDDVTDYSFDTGIIEHLTYPRDLRFGRIVNFKEILAKKIEATYQASLNSDGYSMFLHNFGKFNVSGLSEASGSVDQALLQMMSEMQVDLARVRRATSLPNVNISSGGVRANRVLSSEFEKWADYYVRSNLGGDLSKLNAEDAFGNAVANMDLFKYFESPSMARRWFDNRISVLLMPSRTRDAERVD
ncbi:hypothetical protein K32_28590 [Kaistia sp. 32K]|uniref:hypothetical protein n=1 Tax=Kaistia sp. 32K TaxID=2795690 RepID=UPI001916AAED|nr:hypothetical protein [Kaistia sp. 32K]BCP54242.1 hypothetical protein K32_28590 [Kaistia sp. 32K]